VSDQPAISAANRRSERATAKDATALPFNRDNSADLNLQLDRNRCADPVTPALAPTMSMPGDAPGSSAVATTKLKTGSKRTC